ncbi:hypothetical protein HKX48_000896 [Thoreauomyces humboldtii]|nr:hypothetical protein HKX48_000896 [Thoreauomyces humboldtii]
MHSASKESDAERGTFVSNGQDEKAKKTRKPQGFTIPLSLLLLVGSMAIAAAICVPVAVLAFVGASQTVDTVVTIVRQNYAQIVRNWILNLGAQTESVAAIGASGPALLRALDTLVDGVHHDFAQDADIAWEFYNLWKSSSSFLTIGFQRTVTQDSFFIGTECISCYALEINQPYCDTFDVLAVDYKNANITLNHTSTQDVGVEPLDPTFPATLQFQGPEWFLDTSSPGDPVLQNLLFFYINQWLGLPIGENDTTVPVGNFEVVLDGRQLSAFLADIDLPEHSLIVVWTDTDAIVAISLYDQLAAPGELPYNASTHPLATVSLPAQHVLAKYGSYDNVPDNYVETTQTSSGVYFTNLVRVTEYGMNWFILVSIAESDIDGPIVESRRKVLITSIITAFAMLVVAAASSFLITLPLKSLTKVMKQATNMDFSALSGKTLDSRMPIRELSDMQQVFHEMLAKFAAAITANKRLQMPPGARQSFNSPTGSNGSHVSRSPILPGAVATRETIGGEAL